MRKKKACLAQSMSPTDEFFAAERWKLQLKDSFSTLSLYIVEIFAKNFNSKILHFDFYIFNLFFGDSL